MTRTSEQPSPIELSIAASNDLDAVMTVMSSAFDPCFGEAWTRSQCAGILPMSGVTLVVARGRDDQPLGFALSRMASDEAELLLLAVSPEHRRLGVGRRLLDDFVQRSHALGARRVHLEVRDGNPAVEMYSGAGFTSAGRRRNYYRGQDGSQFDAITLTRDI